MIANSLCTASAVLLLVGTAVADDDVVARGKYLSDAGGCVSCHAQKKSEEMSGGAALETPLGTFFAPNITPDRETGIGAWTDEEFIRAFREGRSPAGQNYFPSFPYPSYAGMSDADLLAIKAYLFSLEPIVRGNSAHVVPWFLTQGSVGFWKFLYFDPAIYKDDPQQSAAWNRGAYLTRHVGHCGECHSPRDSMGGIDPAHALSGNPDGPEGEKVPNITPDPDTGIGSWSASDIAFFLEIGMLPDGDFVGASMGEVIDNTGKLTNEDREAIAAYLTSLPPLPSAVQE